MAPTGTASRLPCCAHGVVVPRYSVFLYESVAGALGRRRDVAETCATMPATGAVASTREFPCRRVAGALSGETRSATGFTEAALDDDGIFREINALDTAQRANPNLADLDAQLRASGGRLFASTAPAGKGGRRGGHGPCAHGRPGAAGEHLRAPHRRSPRRRPRRPREAASGSAPTRGSTPTSAGALDALARPRSKRGRSVRRWHERWHSDPSPSPARAYLVERALGALAADARAHPAGIRMNDAVSLALRRALHRRHRHVVVDELGVGEGSERLAR